MAAYSISSILYSIYFMADYFDYTNNMTITIIHHAALLINPFGALLLLIFFVLRLHMVFANTTYQVSKSRWIIISINIGIASTATETGIILWCIDPIKYNVYTFGFVAISVVIYAIVMFWVLKLFITRLQNLTKQTVDITTTYQRQTTIGSVTMSNSGRVTPRHSPHNSSRFNYNNNNNNNIVGNQNISGFSTPRAFSVDFALKFQNENNDLKNYQNIIVNDKEKFKHSLENTEPDHDHEKRHRKKSSIEIIGGGDHNDDDAEKQNNQNEKEKEKEIEIKIELKQITNSPECGSETTITPVATQLQSEQNIINTQVRKEPHSPPALAVGVIDTASPTPTIISTASSDNLNFGNYPDSINIVGSKKRRKNTHESSSMKQQRQLIGTVAKYTVLLTIAMLTTGLIGVISTIRAFISHPWFLYVQEGMLCIDALCNIICLMLQYSFLHQNYLKICCLCDKCFRAFYFRQFGFNLENKHSVNNISTSIYNRHASIESPSLR